MNVNPGELDKRIKFITTASETDSDGFPAEPVETIFHECWASVSHTSGTEIIKANAEFSEIKTRFMIRYTKKEINQKMEILFNAKHYNIAYMNNYNLSNEYIEIFATIKELI